MLEFIDICQLVWIIYDIYWLKLSFYLYIYKCIVLKIQYSGKSTAKEVMQIHMFFFENLIEIILKKRFCLKSTYEQ